MGNFSEINTLELKAKENRLIIDTETLRLKVISDLNLIEKNCAQIREIQLELIKRENATTTPEA
jgi:hypothetical protein